MVVNYCDYCGAKYPEKLRDITLLSEAISIQCPACEVVRSFYSVAIAVLLQPVVTNRGETGLLVRHQDRIGGPDRYVELPSCFFHIGEDTKHVLVRETGIDIDSDTLRDFAIYTDRHDKYLYLFFVNEKILYEKDLLLHYDEGNDRRVIITGYNNERFPSPLEQEMVKRFFDELWYEESE